MGRAALRMVVCTMSAWLLSIGACRPRTADGVGTDAAPAPQADHATADSADIADGALETTNPRGTVWPDASVEPVVEHVRCMGPRAARTVRFVITPWKRGGGAMRASLSSGNGEIKIPIYDSRDTLGQCASLVVDEGVALRFRCPGESGEIRGEARWTPPILQITTATGTFGYTTAPRSETIEKRSMEWSCASQVTFVAASRSDYDFKDVPWDVPPSFVLPFDHVEQ
jgi:hypothetical protein